MPQQVHLFQYGSIFIFKFFEFLSFVSVIQQREEGRTRIELQALLNTQRI
ncbi:hypothetical protein pb186bvf_018921 [Paramecium bursaria]